MVYFKFRKKIIFLGDDWLDYAGKMLFTIDQDTQRKKYLQNFIIFNNAFELWL